MAPKKSQGKSKSKGPAPKVPRPSAPVEPVEDANCDPVNAAILERLAQIESQLGADGVGQATSVAVANAAAFQAQVLAWLSFIQSRYGEAVAAPGGAVDPMLAVPSTSSQSSVPATTAPAAGNSQHIPGADQGLGISRQLAGAGFTWPWDMGSSLVSQGLQVPPAALEGVQALQVVLPGAQGYSVLVLVYSWPWGRLCCHVGAGAILIRGLFPMTWCQQLLCHLVTTPCLWATT